MRVSHTALGTVFALLATAAVADDDGGAKLPLPGITVSTGPDDYLPFQQLRLRRFNGKSRVGFGEILDDR
jgi:hypothetical protein